LRGPRSRGTATARHEHSHEITVQALTFWSSAAAAFSRQDFIFQSAVLSLLLEALQVLCKLRFRRIYLEGGLSAFSCKLFTIKPGCGGLRSFAWVAAFQVSLTNVVEEPLGIGARTGRQLDRLPLLFGQSEGLRLVDRAHA